MSEVAKTSRSIGNKRRLSELAEFLTMLFL
jgi:hypothetical protein